MPRTSCSGRVCASSTQRTRSSTCSARRRCARSAPAGEARWRTRWQRKDGVVLDILLSSAAARSRRLGQGGDVHGAGRHGAERTEAACVRVPTNWRPSAPRPRRSPRADPRHAAPPRRGARLRWPAPQPPTSTYEDPRAATPQCRKPRTAARFPPDDPPPGRGRHRGPSPSGARGCSSTTTGRASSPTPTPSPTRPSPPPSSSRSSTTTDSWRHRRRP